MADRFYLRASGRTPLITPAFDAGWDQTNQADRVWVDREPKNTASQTVSVDETAATPVNVLARQSVIGPFGAHTYETTDTFKGQLRAEQIGNLANACAQVVIRVADSAGTIEGTLIAVDNSALTSEFPPTTTGLTNRQFPRAGVVNIQNQVVASEGHYLVVEVGARFDNTQTTGRQARVNFMDPYSTADLPEDETTQTALRSWIEYSGTIPHVASLDAYETALRSKPSLRSYWPAEAVDTGLIRDTQQRWPITAIGAPTPITGPTGVLDGALRFDGVDDAGQITIEPTTSVGTVIAWLSTPTSGQTDHDEAAWNTAATVRIRCMSFVQADDAGTIRWTCHYADDADVTHDLLGDAIVVDTWEFLAITVAADGIRFYMADSDVVTLKASDLTPNITALAHQVFRMAQGRAQVLFGQWDEGHVSVHDSVLSITDLQDVYDAAQAGQEVAVGQAIEAETANPVTPLLDRQVPVGQTAEVETANAVTPLISREVTVGQASEAETVNPMVPLIDRQVTVGQASETESPNAVVPLLSREVTVGQASETETANAITPTAANEVTIGQAVERELVQAITPVIGRMVPIGQAVETETGQPITPARGVAVGLATEVELARLISPSKPIFVPLQTAVERELARIISPVVDVPGQLGPAVCEVVSPSAECETFAL